MSLHTPARRLAQTAARSSGLAAHHGPSLHLRYLLPHTQRRNASWVDWLRGRNKKQQQQDPLSAELAKRDKQEHQDRMRERMTNRTAGESIFTEEIKSADAAQAQPSGKSGDIAAVSLSRAKEHVSRALDPDPRWRVRWQRKKVMQMVRNSGKPLTKEEKIKLSEKEMLFKSDQLPTSTKKLMHLARQISGKTVDEAITQMRFSKKKMGSELVYLLNEARDRAIVSRGMGLGKVNGEALAQPKKIQTKDGKWMDVEDPTRLYVDQAWVGRSQWRGYRMQYHARGRMSAMWKPSAYISFLLKEEKTRIRQHDDKTEKQAKKKPWVHLPNRPVTAQRPYYSW